MGSICFILNYGISHLLNIFFTIDVRQKLIKKEAFIEI